MEVGGRAACPIFFCPHPLIKHAAIGFAPNIQHKKIDNKTAIIQRSIKPDDQYMRAAKKR